jgi:hypothetical protein
MKDLVLVDLPGIVHTDESSTVTEMIKKYIEPEESLILVITKATLDNENAEALNLVGKTDPTGERTLRVLTKFDVFDSPDKKKQAIQLINDGLGPLRPHAIVCRPNGDEYNSNTEQTALEGMTDQGIATLKSRLPMLLCNRIQTNLPSLKEQIRATLCKSQDVIDHLGEHEPTHIEVLMKIQKVIKEIPFDLSSVHEQTADKIRHSTYDHYDGDETDDEEERSSIFLKDMVDRLHKNDSFKQVFFQGEETFNKCLVEIVEIWRPITDELKEMVTEILCSFLPSFEFISKKLQMNLEDHWKSHTHKMMDNLTIQFDRMLKKESIWVCDAITESTFWDGRRPEHIHTVRRNMRTIINHVMESRAVEYGRKSLGDQQKERILAAVRANMAPASKTLIDNMLFNLNTEINEAKKHWVDILMFKVQGASEDEYTKSLRKTHLKSIEEMRKCEDILCKLQQ